MDTRALPPAPVDQLFDLEAPGLYDSLGAIALRNMRYDTAGAADLTQDVMIAAVENLHSCRGVRESETLEAQKEALFRWTAGILRNKLLMRVRQRSTGLGEIKSLDEQQESVGEMILSPAYRSAPSPDEDIDRWLELQIVQEDVDFVLSPGVLTDEQREVLRLRYIEELPFEDVATRLGKTAGTVRQLHHRAIRSALRKLTERDTAAL